MELCGKKKKRIPEQSGVAGGGVGGVRCLVAPFAII